MELSNNPQLDLARAFVCNTNNHIFLTGKAGTGKTTFLHQLKNITYKRFVVLAPTGVAAMNAGGVTIHSFFQLPFGPQIPQSLEKANNPQDQTPSNTSARFQRFNRTKINIIRSLDLLVIDEISMVRADLLDAIDAVLRRYKNRNLPFGGLQLLMIGDLHQLAPIAKDNEWELLKNYYESVYFFSSKALKETNYVSIELDHVFRQSDPHFIRLLNKVRDSEPDQETIETLNQRYLPEVFQSDPEGYITLTTHNNQAHLLNSEKLDALPGKPFRAKADIRNEFPEYIYPTEQELLLKKGAQVMFVKNDPSPIKQFFNGKIGKLIDIDTENQVLTIQCPGDDGPIFTGKLEWQNNVYTLNESTKEIEEKTVGTFTQFPIKLAWAITIHKSQGLTFDKAIIDAQAAFAHGQVYVALSRCRSLEGMVFRSRIPSSAIKSNATVKGFMQKVEENSPSEKSLQQAVEAYQLQLVNELFNFNTFRWRLKSLLKNANENSQSLSKELIDNYQKTYEKLEKELIEVSIKFQQQISHLTIQQPFLEKNTALQERIQKASAFFAPLHKSLISKIEMPIETDNKAVKKLLSDALNNLLNDEAIKQACLVSTQKGFVVSELLSVRAKAAAGSEDKKVKSTSKETSAKGKEKKLYQMLKAWRDEVAEAENVEVYDVIQLRTMREIAEIIPTNKKELLKVHGLGRVRLGRYGDQILKVIETYLDESNIEKTLDYTNLEDPEPKVKKVASHLISYEMFKSGKTIQEIATERAFALTTIEGHLSHYVGTGELEPEALVASEKIAVISEYFIETQDPKFLPAREVLGEEYSYGELRIVMSYLKFKKQMDFLPEE